MTCFAQRGKLQVIKKHIYNALEKIGNIKFYKTNKTFTYILHPGRSEIFRSRPDSPWGSTNLLYNGYRVLPESKAAGVWRWARTPI